jgi:hypothetical protein
MEGVNCSSTLPVLSPYVIYKLDGLNEDIITEV